MVTVESQAAMNPNYTKLFKFDKKDELTTTQARFFLFNTPAFGFLTSTGTTTGIGHGTA
jgi:hypothetical protein